MISQILYKIWSLSPILSATRDDNYGYNKQARKKGLRFSVLNLMFGHTTYYLLTFKCTDGKVKFKLREKLSLSECQWRSDFEGEGGQIEKKNNYLGQLSEQYINKHRTDSIDDRIVQKEFLLYLQNNNAYRKSLSYNKMNYYTTVALVFLPLIPAFFKSTFSSAVNNILPVTILYWVLFGSLVYMLINWALLVIQYMAISGISKSTFREIRNPPDGRTKQEQLLYSYYFDWTEERFETNLRVAYVSKTEVFVKAAIILIIALIILPCIAGLLYQSPHTDEFDEVPHIYTINTLQLENPFNEDSIALSELHTRIQKSHPQNILVFANPNIETENIINQHLQPYRDYINIVVYTDTELDTNIFKIALLNEE